MEMQQYIKQNKALMTETLTRLIQIPSVKSAPEFGAPFGRPAADALEYAVNTAKKLGLDACSLDNYVGYADAGEGGECLGILVHLDVVPEGDPAKWEFPPFEAAVKDNVMYGRGTEDDKGPAVAALFALAAVKETGRKFKRRVRLIFGSDEESGWDDIAYYKARQPMPDIAFTPDAEFPIYNAEKGILHAELTCTFGDGEKERECEILSANSGTVINAVPDSARASIKGISMQKARAAADALEAETGVKVTLEQTGEVIDVLIDGVSSHASLPELGKNAATALLKYLTSLPFEYCEGFLALKHIAACFPFGEHFGKAAGIACETPELGKTTASLDILEYDGLSVYAGIDIRHCQTQNPDQLCDIMRNLADMSATIRHTSPYHIVDADCELVKTLLEVYEQKTGVKGECLSMGGGTYARAFPNRAVAFGARFPSRPEKAHCANECMDLGDLELMTEIFAEAIARLALE